LSILGAELQFQVSKNKVISFLVAPLLELYPINHKRIILIRYFKKIKQKSTKKFPSNHNKPISENCDAIYTNHAITRVLSRKNKEKAMKRVQS